uniref:Uncharacterized protein n=2 Tax=Opuntia streptacantha TaxID=393608 RepID=A0A7C9EE88_OPUST
MFSQLQFPPVMMPVFAAKATWELWKYNTSTEGGLRPLGSSPIFGILSALDLKQKTRRVDMITDANGAAADIQKSLGFFKLICLVVSRNTRKLIPITIVCHNHSFLWLKTDDMTGIICIFLVK